MSEARAFEPTGGRVRTVTVIPPRIRALPGMPTLAIQKKCVAAYARVSTNSEEQQTSYEAQVDYYTKYIKSRPDWEFVEVYTDEGITATNTKKREGFKEMVENALAGNIDLIITKSVSRFARNTVDSLTTIRKMKDKGIEVFFEKENIYTLDSKGELVLTIMSSLAQEESRSISENVTWGRRKQFADGNVCLPYKHFLGYKKGEDGKPEVVPAEAAIIRLIYMLFLEGKTPGAIADYLTEQGFPTPTNKSKVWHLKTVESILTNEKYKGSAILQKKYTVNYLEKKMAVNDGQVPKYYIEESHEAIIPPGEFEMVQEEMKRRKSLSRKYSGSTLFASKIICGDCGAYFGAKVWHSNTEYRRVVYRCNEKYEKKGTPRCSTSHLTEEEIKNGFVRALNILISDKQAVLDDCRLLFDTLTETAELDAQIETQMAEREYAMEILKKCVEDNAVKEQSQLEYWKRYDALAERYETEKDKLEKLLVLKEERKHKAELIGAFMFELSEMEGIIETFDARLWFFTVERVVVTEGKKMTFEMRNGAKIAV